jgi:hypothetical protein
LYHADSLDFSLPAASVKPFSNRTTRSDFAVPEARDLNERLSNLLAAHGDLDTLMKAEEVGRGGGITGGKIGSTLVGVAEKGAGRVLPGASKVADASAMPARAGAAAGMEKWVHVQTSDGKEYEVHPEDLGKLMKRDPKARVILSQE